MTPAQERFAKKNRAYPGPRSFTDERMVFFYREGPLLARRWLVSPEGRVVQLDSFARPPQKHRQG